MSLHGDRGLQGGGGDNFVRGLFRPGKFPRGKFRHPCKSQSLLCLTSHCPSSKIRQGNISPPSLKTKISHEIIPAL